MGTLADHLAELSSVAEEHIRRNIGPMKQYWRGRQDTLSDLVNEVSWHLLGQEWTGGSPARGRTSDAQLHQFKIVVNPEDPSFRPEAEIWAINPLDALDRYAMETGFAPYSRMEPLEDWIGLDRHGLWGIYCNYTIYAIPRDPPEEVDQERVQQFLSDLLSHGDDVIQSLVNVPPAIIAAARKSLGAEL